MPKPIQKVAARYKIIYSTASQLVTVAPKLVLPSTHILLMFQSWSKV